MKLYSCKYYGNNIEELNFNTLIEASQNVIRITVLSAYYSNRFLNDRFLSLIPERVRQKCELTIVVNGFGGYRLEEQMDELEELENSLENLGYDDINIYLNLETSLFHTKLYRFETENDIIWFIGSANASESAFTQNEEILVQLKGNYKTFESYIKKVIDDSVLYSEVEEPEINCMVKFWRTGLIYYKPNTNIQFTFSRLKIPAWVKKELTRNLQTPPFTNPGEPWGPFNIKLAMNLDEEEERIQARHNSWSIETCFGYWVPSKYKRQLDLRLQSVTERKKANFDEVLESMESFGEQNLTAQFTTYIEGVKANLNAVYNNYPWSVNDRIVVRFDEDSYIVPERKSRNFQVE